MSLIKIIEIGYGPDGKTLDLVIAIPHGSELNEFYIATQDTIGSDSSVKKGINYISLGFEEVFEKIGESDSFGENKIYDLYKVRSDFPKTISQEDLTILSLSLNSESVESSFTYSDISQCGEDDGTVVVPLFNLNPLRLKALSFYTKDSCELPRTFIDKLLQIKAIKLAILCKDYYQASVYWKKFFLVEEPKPSKHCGCHGRIV